MVKFWPDAVPAALGGETAAGMREVLKIQQYQTEIFSLKKSKRLPGIEEELPPHIRTDITCYHILTSYIVHPMSMLQGTWSQYFHIRGLL